MKTLETTDQSLLAKRGEGTKYALIMAGMALFGEYGLKATSTRMLAERSGANVASIPYYFGNKEGLYHAVVEHIAESFATHLGDALAAIDAKLTAGSLNQALAKDTLIDFLTSIAHIFVDSDEPKAWAQIIMREQANPSAAFESFYHAYMKHYQSLVCRLIGLSAGLRAESDEVKIRAHALFGQILAFLVSRESILRNLGVEKFKAKHLQLIYAVLAGHMEASLKMPPIEPASASASSAEEDRS